MPTGSHPVTMHPCEEYTSDFPLTPSRYQKNMIRYYLSLLSTKTFIFSKPLNIMVACFQSLS